MFIAPLSIALSKFTLDFESLLFPLTTNLDGHKLPNDRNSNSKRSVYNKTHKVEKNMAELATINLDGTEVVIEVEPIDEVIPSRSSVGLPVGAEPTGFSDRIEKAGDILKNNVSGVANIARNALKDIEPDEWTVEVAVKFVGEKSPIPVITKLSGEASIKVTATWKKAS